MAKNAFFASTAVLMACAFYLLQECAFLQPYRRLVFYMYGAPIGLYAAAFFVNLFALIYYAGRKLFLKDTGRKLAHVERQLRTGGSFAEELAQRLND